MRSSWYELTSYTRHQPNLPHMKHVIFPAPTAELCKVPSILRVGDRRRALEERVKEEKEVTTDLGSLLL